MIYNKESIELITDDLIYSKFEESSWESINLKGGDRLLLGCIYKSPNSNQGNNDNLIVLLEKVAVRKHTHILIVGNFNCKEINWTNNTTETSKTFIQSMLLEKITILGWYQHVKSYTRFKEGQKSSLLDLIITNEENMIETCATIIQ